jgi:glycosyltransferase involved in cell wall biosynthesis
MPFPLTDGGAIGIYNITKSLAKLGHEVTLVTFPLDTIVETAKAVEDISQFARLVLVNTALPARWKVLLRTLFSGPYPIERRMMPEMFELLRSILDAETFDVVHVDHAHMGRYGLWIRQHYGLPIVLREHNFEALIYERFAKVEKNPIKRWLAYLHGKRLKVEETQFLREFDAVAAISKEDLAIMRHAAPHERYSVIPAGVDAEYFSPAKVNPDPNRILWIGTFDWDPNFDAIRHFLANIYPRVLAGRPTVHFDIVGASSERLRTFAAPFSESVSLLGRVPDVRDYLANSAVLLVPLRIGGGMRLKLLEFFAAGKAVVSTSIGAEGNIAQDGVHLHIRDSDEDFADGILALLNSPSLREQLAHNARSLALHEYSWEHIAHHFTALYAEAIAHARAGENASVQH